MLSPTAPTQKFPAAVTVGGYNTSVTAVGAGSSVNQVVHTDIRALVDHLLYEIPSDYTPPARAWGYRPATMGTDTLGPCVIRGMVS